MEEMKVSDLQILPHNTPIESKIKIDQSNIKVGQHSLQQKLRPYQLSADPSIITKKQGFKFQLRLCHDT